MTELIYETLPQPFGFSPFQVAGERRIFLVALVIQLCIVIGVMSLLVFLIFRVEVQRPGVSIS